MGAQQPETAVSSLHIVVAEDNILEADIICGELRRLGHLVTHVLDGQALLDYCLDPTNPVDKVIADIGMPKIDGLTAMREIAGKRPLPLIAISGSVDETVVDQALGAGCVNILAKPISLPQLRIELYKSDRFYRFVQSTEGMSKTLAAIDPIERAIRYIMDQRGVGRPKAERILTATAKSRGEDRAHTAAALIMFDDLKHLSDV